MTPEELKEILEQHLKWLRGDGGTRADLSRADLSWADLSRANLSWADLSGADLSWANLSGANLSRANLSRADLSVANLSWANLSRANLSVANLSWADLSRANLSWADLSGADLSWANLHHFQLCPEEGSFVAWGKKGGSIVKMSIPADAQRTSALCGRKCRAAFVDVLEVDGSTDTSQLVVTRRGSIVTEYRPGSRTTADKFDPDIRVECSHGIHFFMTRREAEEWG